MELEVIVPIHPDVDFDFNSARTSPCPTAPSTPKRFGGGYFLSAPASPSHLSGVYDFWIPDDQGPVDTAGKYSVPETSASVSGTPKSRTSDDFSFDVGVVRETPATSVSAAEELFVGGRIKPLDPPPSVTRSSSSSLGAMVKKWRLRDLFLFRSASEGRASAKDPLKKYTAAVGASFRGDSKEGSTRRRGGGGVSAHEMHYTFNRAVSEDMKKRTFLPYKQGILGRLAVNPAVHALANGFGISPKQ